MRMLIIFRMFGLSSLSFPSMTTFRRGIGCLSIWISSYPLTPLINCEIFLAAFCFCCRVTAGMLSTTGSHFFLPPMAKLPSKRYNAYSAFLHAYKGKGFSLDQLRDMYNKSIGKTPRKPKPVSSPPRAPRAARVHETQRGSNRPRKAPTFLVSQKSAAPGEKVLVKWSNGEWYAGVVKSITSAGTRVWYEDEEKIIAHNFGIEEWKVISDPAAHPGELVDDANLAASGLLMFASPSPVVAEPSSGAFGSIGKVVKDLETLWKHPTIAVPRKMHLTTQILGDLSEEERAQVKARLAEEERDLSISSMTAIYRAA